MVIDFGPSTTRLVPPSHVITMASPGTDVVENALQTLATAASLEGHGHASERQQREIPMDLIDPLLQNSAFNTFDPSYSTAALLNLNLLPADSLGFATPVQQTRSGRISRPPTLDAQQAFFANLQAPSASQPLSAAAVQQVTNAVIQNWHLFAGSVPSSLGGPPIYPESDSASTPKGRKRQGSTPVPSRADKGKRKKQRRITPEEDDDDLLEEEDDLLEEDARLERASASARPEGVGMEVPGLPEWPLPPKGPKSRKTMPREEMLARRRARNRVAAVESRKKKREMASETETKLQESERRYGELLHRYTMLENEVKTLRLALASSSGAAHAPPNAAAVSFNQMFSDDDNDEDPEFIPSSPQNHDDGHGGDDSESSSEEEEEDGESDEDLFLPIQDVPIPEQPPVSEVQRLMSEHGLDLNTLRLLGENARKQGLLN